MKAGMDESRHRWSNLAIVAVGSALVLLIFELLFKWRVILSDGLILDDTFMFERAIHGRPFNDLGEFLPAFQAVDLDKSEGLKFYRYFAEISGDISTMRIIYLGFFAVACAIFALLVYRVTRNQIFSILTAAFAFITPFSPILVLFTNGSYNVVYFALFFAALLVGTYICFENKVRQTLLLVSATTVLLLLSAVFVEVGFLLSLAALAWLFYFSKAYQSSLGRALFFLSGVLVSLQAAWILVTYTSPYEAMPGRVNYDLSTMFLNGLSIIQRSVSSFWDPMFSTGQLTLRPSLWISIGFICVILAIYAVTALRLFRGGLDWEDLRTPLSFTLFMSVCAVLSIGPYTALRSSHLWHYFPHMIFLCASSFLLLYYTVSKWGAYLLIAITAALTAHTYSRQMPAYQDIVQQQKQMADFVRQESNSWREEDRIFLVFDGEILAGLNSPFRSTGFSRYVLDNPDAPILSIVNTTSENVPDAGQESGEPKIYLYEMDHSGTYNVIR